MKSTANFPYPSMVFDVKTFRTLPPHFSTKISISGGLEFIFFHFKLFLFQNSSQLLNMTDVICSLGYITFLDYSIANLIAHLTTLLF